MKGEIWLVIFVFICITVSLYEGKLKQPVSTLEDRLLKTFTDLKFPNKRVHVQQKSWRTWTKGPGPVKNGKDVIPSGGISKLNVANSGKVLGAVSTVRNSRYISNIIAGIKNGSITDANVIFNYLSFETFKWDNEFCLKCLMGDFKAEIGSCYNGKITVSSWKKGFSSWSRTRYRFKRSGSQNATYDCWWCKGCLK